MSASKRLVTVKVVSALMTWEAPLNSPMVVTGLWLVGSERAVHVWPALSEKACSVCPAFRLTPRDWPLQVRRSL